MGLIDMMDLVDAFPPFGISFVYVQMGVNPKGCPRRRGKFGPPASAFAVHFETRTSTRS